MQTKVTQSQYLYIWHYLEKIVGHPILKDPVLNYHELHISLYVIMPTCHNGIQALQRGCYR